MGKSHPGAWEPRLSPRRYAHLQLIGSPRLSPDGERIAFVGDVNGRADIFVVDRAGGVPVQVTAEHPAPGISGLYGAASGFTWSPDGTRIIYTTPDDGQLWSIGVDGDACRRVTSGPGAQQKPDWNEGGIVYIRAVPDQDTVDVALVTGDDTGADWPRRLNPPGRFYLSACWSPDGQQVAMVSYDKARMFLYESAIEVVNVASGDHRTLIAGDNVYNADPAWSPDGQRIAFISDRSGWNNVWLVDVATGEMHHAVAEHHEHAEPRWSPDGRLLAYTRNIEGSLQITLLDVSSGTTSPLTSLLGTHAGLEWSPDGREIFCSFQSPQHAPRIVAIDVTTGARRDVVGPTLAGLETSGLIMPRSIRYPSVDDLEIHAMLWQPEEIRPGEHPLLVHIHGGPMGQYGYRWDPTVQYFVQRGWVVVEPNFRGSTGYGRAFLDGLNNTWGALDLEDNTRSIAAVAEEGLIDPSRAVAWGGSGGGYATMVCVTRKPDDYAAGVALYGLSNLVSFGEQTDRLARDLVPWLLGPSRMHYQRWVERSPITHVDQVRVPLLVLHGDADWRVTKEQSEEFVQALEQRGKTVEYKLYEGEGHGWRRAETIMDYVERMDNFLTKYVIERTTR